MDQARGVFNVKSGEVVRAIAPGMKDSLTVAASKVEFFTDRVVIYDAKNEVRVILNPLNFTAIAFGPPPAKKKEP